MRIVRWTVFPMLAAVGMLLLVGCGGGSDDAAPAEETVVGVQPTVETEAEESVQAPEAEGGLAVGIAATPPWVVLDPQTGEFTGPTVTLLNAVAEKLNTDINFVNITYGTGITALRTGQIEIGALPFFDTEERKEVVDFVLWTEAGNCYVTRKDNNKINSLDDLNSPDVTMVLGVGTSIETDFSKKYPLAETYSVQVEAAVSPVQDVLAGRADVTYVDHPVIRKWLAEHPQLRAVPEPDECQRNPDFPHNIGMVIRKDASDELRATLEGTVEEMRPVIEEELTKYSQPEFLDIPDVEG